MNSVDILYKKNPIRYTNHHLIQFLKLVCLFFYLICPICLFEALDNNAFVVNLSVISNRIKILFDTYLRSWDKG